MTPEQIREVALRSLDVLGELGPQIQWLHSWVTDNKVYCIYFAPDEELIRKHAEMGDFPVDRISAVRELIDPSDYA